MINGSRKQKWIILTATVLTVSCAAISVLLWQGRLPLRTLTCDGQIESLRFSPNGRVLATLVEGQGIVLWDTKRWRQIRVLPGRLSTLYFLPDSRSLVTYSLHGGPGAESVNRWKGLTMSQWKLIKNSNIQGRLQRWDIASGRTLTTFTLPLSTDEDAVPEHHLAVFLRRVAPTGISLLDTQSGQEIHFLPGGTSLSAVLSPDGHWLCVIDRAAGGSLTLWDTQTWRKKPLLIPNQIISSGMEDVCFSPDGRWLGMAASQTLNLWRTTDFWHGRHLITGYTQVCRLAFSFDSKQVVVGGAWTQPQQTPWHMGLTIWESATGRKTAVLDNQEEAFWRITSRGILTHDLDDHSRNVLWDSQTGQRLWQGQAVGFPDAAVSPDGRTLVTTRLAGFHSNENKGIIEIRHLPGN